ncbi:MAG: tRNA (N6-isopentenyl adenosine(37)-C2)-methylthiotransferase MiaB [Acidobacteriota bacterium]|jgi:tRNA-2-methylthio-N6-dimethylallyladenosine synthase|nr:tRNA (N6-isopentenyl adenosine(37)-C2)-methylthiotransferase MiaB [Acidobacteriota bacterium]
MTFFIHTFGCQMNVNDSEKIASILRLRGMTPADRVQDARIVIINSCAVRAKAREKALSFIGRLDPEQIVILAGCVAQAERQSLLKTQRRIDYLVGTHQFHKLDRIVDGLMRRREKGAALGFSRQWQELVPDSRSRNSAVTAFVSIMEGCDNFCSYCIVPFTRGREKNRPARYILAEAMELAQEGYREIVLLGQNVNHWIDPETGESFASLLDRLASAVDVRWIRFITSYPGYHDPRLIDVVAAHSNIARHIHLPAQSGSTRMLRRMRRNYSRVEYLKIITAYRRAVPGMSFSADFIVGFPGESEKDFLATLSLLRRVEYESVFSFAYSPRPATRASAWRDSVPAEVKRERLRRLQQLQEEIQLRRNHQLIGSLQDVLVMTPHPSVRNEVVARTETYRVVNVESVAVPGSMLKVRITAAGPHSLRGVEAAV